MCKLPSGVGPTSKFTWKYEEPEPDPMPPEQPDPSFIQVMCSQFPAFEWFKILVKK